MKTIIFAAFLLLFLASPIWVLAQEDEESSPEFNTAFSNGSTEADAPVDGGLSLLVGAGVAYYAKMGYNRRKRHNNATNEAK